MYDARPWLISDRLVMRHRGRHHHAACLRADLLPCHLRRLYLSSDQFVYNPYYLVSNSPMQTTLGDARLRDAGLSFYRKNGRVSISDGLLFACLSSTSLSEALRS